jgi:exodeoxyribonuclease V gamma subunit
VKSYIRGKQCAPAEVLCVCNGYSITGTVKDIWPEILLRYRCATVKAKDRIRIWIQHLVLNAVESPVLPKKSILIGTDHIFEAEPNVDCARQHLGSLVKIFQRGRKGLTYIFPESSLAYVGSMQKGKTCDDALKAARLIWYGNDYAPGEGEDPYYSLCFKNIDPFTESFEALSRELYEPLMQHQKQVT